MTLFQPSGSLLRVEGGGSTQLNLAQSNPSLNPFVLLGFKRPTGAGILAHAKSKVGSQYVLGTLVPKNDPNYIGAFDCAELIAWAIYKETGRLYGTANNAGDAATADAFTGYFDRDAKSLGKMISIEEALTIPGAILMRRGGSGPHVALSDGYGGTVEAMGTAYGVLETNAKGRIWDYGILPNIPGVNIKWEPTSAVARGLFTASKGARSTLPVAIAASAGVGVVALVGLVAWKRKQRKGMEAV